MLGTDSLDIRGGGGAGIFPDGKTFDFFAPVGKQTIFLKKIPAPQPLISNGPSIQTVSYPNSRKTVIE